MIRITLILLLCSIYRFSFSQGNFPHTQAHAHNDYEHVRPLWDALENGFISVEADVHLIDGKLLVSHGRPKRDAFTLTQLYLAPLDSLVNHNDNKVYSGYLGIFYLMIDSKTEAESTYRAIQKEIEQFKRLLCNSSNCPVKIFISGNRAIDTMMKDGYKGLALDGRPGDLGKGISFEQMPVISDNYSNWSTWNGKTDARSKDLDRIRELSQRVHAEGKKLRLWAIPDNEITWTLLLEAGVDVINTDRLSELHKFLSNKGL